MHPPGQGGHDHPHRHARSALPARRPQRCSTNWSSASTRTWCATPAAEFVAAKLAEREERHRRGGQSRYLVEPNVKEGKGGLRDLHTLFWIAKYVYRVREPDELVKRGVFDKQEYQLFRRCEDFLWSVRCHLHFVTGRAEERLSFDIQREIAVRLGYTEHPGQQDVERFMKHYFLIAKDVGDLTAIVCAELEDSQAKTVPVLSRVMAKLRPVKRKTLAESDDFIVEKNRIRIVNGSVFRRDPVNLIRIFHLAQKHNLAFHPDAMRAMTRSLKLIDAKLRDNEEANRLFLDILTSKNDPETVLRRMNEAGVLGRFVPAFGKIVAMMQFNMYHHYTVDEHLLRCIGILTEIERGTNKDTALANELIHKTQAGQPQTPVRRRCSCTTSPRAGPRIIRSPARAWRGASARGSAFPPPIPRQSPG